MRNLKWRLSLGAFFLAVVLLFTYYPLSAEAAYSGNIIPAMTSYNSPSGIVTANYEVDSAWRAFDEDPLTYWSIDDTQGWVEYEFPTPRTVTKYSFTTWESIEPPLQHYVGVITHVYFKAYDEATQTWVELDSSDPPYKGYDVEATYDYPINNSKAYKKYRLYIENGPRDAAALIVTRLAMYEDGPIDISGHNTAHTQGFDFITSKKVNKIQFNLNNTGTAYLPTTSKVEGYNETSGQWENISYTGTIAFGSNQFILNNTKAYKKYRLNLNFNQVSSVNLTGLTAYGND